MTAPSATRRVKTDERVHRRPLSLVFDRLILVTPHPPFSALHLLRRRLTPSGRCPGDRYLG
ncbi:hypothetical protein [Gordonia sp. 'Campus']|uniref:hypothetical protein n=1 Tax=Gordonia sp. 'Campus' TaxID=2915824 RepID=UPI001EE4C4FF|nr:hypothetical protein [Gordonia sp. 'Campus']